jgi:hypothetical protein
MKYARPHKAEGIGIETDHHPSTSTLSVMEGRIN